MEQYTHIHADSTLEEILDSLKILVDMKAQALAERDIERAEVIDEIIAERLYEAKLTVILKKRDD